MITLSKVQSTTLTKLQAMVKDPNFFPGWANTQGLAIYAQAQMNRWETENGSESGGWKALNPKYAARKRRIYGGGVRMRGRNKGEPYGNYFGSGSKMLIATSRMLASVLPPQYRQGPTPGDGGEEFRKAVYNNSLELASATPYAPYVDQIRTFSTWPQGGATRSAFAASFKAYLATRGKSGAQ